MAITSLFFSSSSFLRCCLLLATLALIRLFAVVLRALSLSLPFSSCDNFRFLLLQRAFELMCSKRSTKWLVFCTFLAAPSLNRNVSIIFLFVLICPFSLFLDAVAVRVHARVAGASCRSDDSTGFYFTRSFVYLFYSNNYTLESENFCD